MKRSRYFRPVTIGLLGVSAFTLAACKQEPEQASAFPDLQSCIAESVRPNAAVTEQDCTTAYAQAVQTNVESAPRYDALAVCEQEHGAGNCQQADNPQGGGGSIFMPLLTGFLLGKMLSGGGAIMSQPLYPKQGGGYATPNGQSFANNRGAGAVPTSTFAKPARTIDKAPVSANPRTIAPGGGNSTVRSTGGFGTSATGSGG